MYNIITSHLQPVKVNSTSVNNYSSKEIVEIIMHHNRLVEISLKMKLWKTAAAHVRSISKLLAGFNIPVEKTYMRYNMKAILAEVNEVTYNPYSPAVITKCCMYSLHKKFY